MKRHIPQSTWQEIQTAYAGGVPLREIARKMGIPSGTILSRAKRENWTLKAASVKLKERPELARDLLVPSSDITTHEAIAMTMRERADRYTDRMAGIGEKVLPHIESLSPVEILYLSEKIDRLDRVARRSFGLDKEVAPSPLINLNLLSLGIDDLVPKSVVEM